MGTVKDRDNLSHQGMSLNGKYYQVYHHPLYRTCQFRETQVLNSLQIYLSVEALGGLGHAVRDPADDGVGELASELHGEVCICLC